MSINTTHLSVLTAAEYLNERQTSLVPDGQLQGSFIRGFYENLEQLEYEGKTDDDGVHRFNYQRQDLDKAFLAAEKSIEAA
jgi:hypothetical protein